MNDNTEFCSGCLVNNTQQDFTPYILTARHCIFPNNGHIQTFTLATIIFRFQYWKPNCGSGTPPTNFSITGATLRAHHAPADFALVELNSMPPVNWNLYYAGWDRTTAPAQNATTIHHPQADAMKISHEQHPVVVVNQTVGGQVLSFWRVQHFEQGTAQGGSSGSPLFNQNHRIVGQAIGRHISPNPCAGLTGAALNTCDCNNPIEDYGRFDISWTGGGTNATRLSNWLDPNSTGVTILNGVCPPVDFINKPSVTTPTTVTSCGDINVGNVSVNNAKLTLEVGAGGGVIFTGDLDLASGTAELEIK